MQQQGKNVFIGMDQDMSKSSTERNQKYWEALNVSVMLNEEGSNLTATNERGNKELFSLPYIYIRQTPDPVAKWTQPSGVDHINFTNKDQTILPTHMGAIATSTHNVATFPSQANMMQYHYYNQASVVVDGVTKISPATWTILGSVTLRDKIIIFSVYEKNSDPTKSPCAIWEMVYGKDLVSTTTLIYLGPLEFSASNPIKGVSSHENANVSKVYWEDGKLNQLRHLNTEKDNFLFTPYTNLNTCPDVTLSQPTLTSLVGGNHKAGVLQYAYVLFNKNAESSNISPFSDIAPVTSNNEGIASGSTGSVSFEVTCANLDSRFDSLRLYRLHYGSLTNTPDISLISEIKLNLNQTLYNFIDSGSNTEIATVSTTEFANLYKFPLKPNAIASKNNKLILGNIDEESFQVDYDARAYRFRVSTQYTELLDSSGSPTGYNLTNDAAYIALAENLDVIAPANKAQQGANHLWKEFKYINNSTTLGAEGLNVKVTFTTDTLAEGVFIEPTNYNKRGYKRDEIYRFGVVFFNNKGQRSFAKWIADLRFPDAEDNASWGHMHSSNLLGLYPVFELNNLDSLPDNVVGYQIVRLERDPQNRTILSQGVFNSTMYDGIEGTEDVQLIRPDYGFRRFTGTNSLILLSQYPMYNGIDVSSAASFPGEINKGSGKYITKTDFFTFHSPEIEYGTITPKTTAIDHFQIWGGSTTVGLSSHFQTLEYIVEDDSGFQSSLDSTPYHWNTSGTQSEYATDKMGIEMNPKLFQVKGGNVTGSGSFNTALFTTVGELYIFEPDEKRRISTENISFENRIKVEGSEHDSKPSKKRKKKYVEAKSPKLLVGRVDHFGGPTLTSKVSAVVAASTLGTYVIGDYKRLLLNQYGGDSYEQRSYSEYMPCGDYQSITANTHTQTVKNGDIFVTYYKLFHMNYETLANQQDEDNVSVADDNDYNLLNQGNTKAASHVSHKSFLQLPIESTINLDLKSNKKQERADSFEKTPDSWWDYNSVYQREGNYEKYYPRPFGFVSISSFENMFRYSQTKISNEEVDSYTEFYANDFKEVARESGAVSGLYNVNNSIFTTLDRGIGIWNVDPTAQVSSSSGVINLGNGAYLNNFVALSTTNGTTHRTGAIASKSNLYVVDDRANKIFNISAPQLALSDTIGIHSILKTRIGTSNLSGSPLHSKAVTCGYDPYRNTIYFTFFIGTDQVLSQLGGGVSTQYAVTDKFTLSYSELTNTFVSYHSYTPSLYFNNSRYMFMCPQGTNNSTIWIYGFGDFGNYFGNIFNTDITILSNHAPDSNKIFYNLYYRMEGYDDQGLNDETVNFSSYQAYTDNQSTGTVQMLSNRHVDKHMRYWRVGLDRNNNGTSARQQKERLTNSWMFVKLNYSNDSNKNFRLHNTITNFSVANY